MAVSILGEAAVRLRPNSEGFAAEAEAGIAGPLGGVAKKAAGLFAAAFAAEKVGVFLKDSITQASDLSESTSKVGVVFGSASQEVLDFAAHSSTAFGQSRAQALEAAGTFGNLLRSIGLTEQASADMSTSMVGLASDLASFNNTDPAEALEALRAGLTGETEPLKRYGINLNDATLKQEALRLGLDATGPTLSATAKAQAAYSLIMQQSSLAQGDFARTSAGLANQQRIMSSQWVDLEANVGGLFVPAIANASGILTGRLMPGLLDATSRLPELGADFGSLGDYVRDGLGSFTGDELHVATTGIGGDLQWAAFQAGTFGSVFGEAMADGKTEADLLAADGIEGLAARAGVAAFRIRQDFTAAWMSLRTSLEPVLGPLIGTFANVFATIKAAVVGSFSGIGGALSGVFGGGGGLGGFAAMIGGALNAILPVVTGVLSHFIGIIQAWLPVVGQVIAAVVPIISTLFAQLGPIISALLPIITELASLWRDALLTAIQAFLPVLPVLVQVIGQVAQILGGALLNVIQQLAPIIPQLVGVVGQLAGTFGQVLGNVLTSLAPVLPVLAQAFASIASVIAGALGDVLGALLPILPPIADALGQVAQALAGALADALNAVLPILPTLIGALVQLVVTAITPFLPLLPILAQLFATIVSALAPIIPPVVQIITLLVQLAVMAIQPLMPIITLVAGLLGVLLRAFMPIITIVVQVIGWFVQLAAKVISVVVGMVSTVVGVFTSLWTGISRIVTNIVSGATNNFRALVNGVKSIFSGIADFVGGMFSGIGGAIKGAINAVIRGINGTVIAGINLVIDGVNVVNPFDDVPHVPRIPTFHSGGIFTATAGDEGLALLRNAELVATPEQRTTAEGLLGDLLDGALPAGAATGGGAPIQVHEHVYQQPGEPVGAVAARVTQNVVWRLNGGITRTVGAEVPTA